jgi:hypothetical protein
MVFVLSLEVMLCMGEQYREVLAYLPPFKTHYQFAQKSTAEIQPDTSRTFL